MESCKIIEKRSSERIGGNARAAVSLKERSSCAHEHTSEDRSLFIDRCTSSATSHETVPIEAAVVARELAARSEDGELYGRLAERAAQARVQGCGNAESMGRPAGAAGQP